jgi:hypothetical protein
MLQYISHPQSRFCLSSSPRSLAAGQVSILAILEIVLSLTAAALLLTFFPWNSLFFPITIIMLAPLFAIRTPLVIEIAYSKYIRLVKFTKNVDRWQEPSGTNRLTNLFRQYSGYLIFLVAIPFSGLWIRFSSFIQAFYREPLFSIKEMPRNYFRIILLIDSCFPPEMVPGLENSPPGIPRLYRRMWHRARRRYLLKTEYKTYSKWFKYLYSLVWSLESFLMYGVVWITRALMKLTIPFWVFLFFIQFSFPHPTKDIEYEIWYARTDHTRWFRQYFVVLQIFLTVLVLVWITHVWKFPLSMEMSNEVNIFAVAIKHALIIFETFDRDEVYLTALSVLKAVVCTITLYLWMTSEIWINQRNKSMIEDDRLIRKLHWMHVIRGLCAIGVTISILAVMCDYIYILKAAGLNEYCRWARLDRLVLFRII